MIGHNLILSGELDSKPVSSVERQTLQNLAKRKQQQESKEQKALREQFWQIERLLWLAYMKGNPSTCNLAKLPRSALLRIMENFRKGPILKKKTTSNTKTAPSVAKPTTIKAKK